MRIGEDNLLIDAVRGAVDSYIRMINEAEKDDINGKGIIKPEWYYYIDPSNEDFVILLEVRGFQEEITLKKSEWKSYQSNMLGNEKIKQLANRWS
ncbi:hypothetical protein [Cytobacillus solani]|uniref:Uncharacterized protein n=1 Tax=Cytobacillus solani TaxID=1637975 RepID=A0A0Q3T5N2_9BACI|nr:hypothetical protein [Cytobacillus solani]KQL27508.1 hypothetical protein AN957_00785 [Cytobacillus solani]